MTSRAAGITLAIPASLGFSVPPEALEVARKGGVTTVSYAPAQELLAFAPTLASRRPAPEATLVAYGNNSTPRPPVAARPPPPPMVLTLALALGPDASAVELAPPPFKTAGKIRRHAVTGGTVVAGPPMQQALPPPDPEETVDPDVLAGCPSLPEVDVATGHPDNGEPWTPPALPTPHASPNNS